MGKSKVDSLALFGGEPTFATPLHVNKPNAAPRAAFDEYFTRAWNSSWFTNDGPLVQEFEGRLATYLGTPHVILTCNGTAALQLLIQALGLSGEVILPSYTFVSSANALQLAGLTPVFCDIDAATMNIDPAACRPLITPRTSAVIATHIWGTPCATEQLQALCDAAGISLLFDAAHAFGVSHKGRRIGGFGRAEIFSLHATKVLHSFEGGLVTTSDSALADELRLRRNFGFSSTDQITLCGINAKMSEAHAAMGLANLDVFDATITANRRCHDTYATGLADIEGLTLRRPRSDDDANWHYVVAEIDSASFGLSRDQLAAILATENILARRYFYPGCHRSPPHLPRSGAPPSLPRTDAACNNVIVLPAGAAIDLDDVKATCHLIRLAARHAGEIHARLAQSSAGSNS